jgi:hypothetical protein
MSLFDAIKNVTINTVMSQNKGLSKITSTTFSQAGTSINSIRNQTLSSVNTSLGSTDYSSQLYSPVTQMSNFALSQSTGPAQQNAIATATNTAYAAVDSSFNSAFPSATSVTLFDIQSAATQSISNGVSNFGNSLSAIDGNFVAPALSLGNAALVQAGNTADALVTSVYKHS